VGDLYGIDTEKYPMVDNPDYAYWGKLGVGGGGGTFTKKSYATRYRPYNHSIVDTIIKFYGRPERVISLGCGVGFDVERFAQLGIDVVGLEIAEHMIEASPVGERIVRGSMTDLSQFRDNEFDLVVCLEVMEHLPPELTEQAISEMRRVGTKRGVLTIGRGKSDPTHINLRPREAWIELLAPMDDQLLAKISNSLKEKRLVDMVWDRVYTMRLDDESNNTGSGDGNKIRS